MRLALVSLLLLGGFVTACRLTADAPAPAADVETESAGHICDLGTTC